MGDSMSAFYQSSTVSVTGADNAFGTAVTLISSVPFAARRIMILWNSGTTLTGMFQISVSGFNIIPYFIADSGDALSQPVAFNVFIPAGASVSVSAATSGTTGTYSVAVVLFDDSDGEVGFQVIAPGITLPSYQVNSGGAGVWTALGGALASRTKNIKIFSNTDYVQQNFSFGYGTSSTAVTPILNAVPMISDSYYPWTLFDLGDFKIPAGQTLYAMSSEANGAYFPMITI